MKEAVEVESSGHTEDLLRRRNHWGLEIDSVEAGEVRERWQMTPIFAARYFWGTENSVPINVCGIELSFKIIMANKSCQLTLFFSTYLVITTCMIFEKKMLPFYKYGFAILLYVIKA